MVCAAIAAVLGVATVTSLGSMRGFFGRVLPAVAVLAVLGVPNLTDAREAPDSFADLAEKSLPAVVNVSTTTIISGDTQNQDLDELFRQFLDRQQGEQAPKPRKATSLGSGFIIDATGYIVTNNHVIENA